MGNKQEQGNLSAVVLFSGGLDSTVLLHQLVTSYKYDRIQPLFFFYGQRHLAAEERASSNVLSVYYGPKILTKECIVVPDIFVGGLVSNGDLTQAKSTIVPFRNGVMLSMAAAYAESNHFDTIWIAAHKTDNPYPDCRPAFLRNMADAIYAGTEGHVILRYPYIGMTKGTIIAGGDLMGAAMHLTWSCYEGGEVHCGKCASCVERRRAFEEAHVNDPTEYRK